MAKNGRPDHTFTRTTAKRARLGTPSHSDRRRDQAQRRNVQLKTLYVESNIQVHASTPREAGTTHGTRTAPRIHFMPGAGRASTRARTTPSTSFARDRRHRVPDRVQSVQGEDLDVEERR